MWHADLGHWFIFGQFEEKHKEFKVAARSTSFKNILETSQHHQCLLAYRLHCKRTFASATVCIDQVPSYIMNCSCSTCCISMLFLILCVGLITNAYLARCIFHFYDFDHVTVLIYQMLSNWLNLMVKMYAKCSSHGH